jgi:hypothetical protein
MLQNLIIQKARDSSSLNRYNNARQPTACEIGHIRSEVSMFPYPYFFRGRISEEPHVFNRGAGWSPQISYTYPKDLAFNPSHCFQPSCNAVFTKFDCDGKCVKNDCVNTYR